MNERTESAKRVAARYLTKQAGAHQYTEYVEIPDVKKAFAKFKAKNKASLPPNANLEVRDVPPMSKGQAGGVAAREGFKNITRSYLVAFPVGSDGAVTGWYFLSNHYFD